MKVYLLESIHHSQRSLLISNKKMIRMGSAKNYPTLNSLKIDIKKVIKKL